MDTCSHMAKQSRSLEHARHNEKVFKTLDRDPDSLDWVITIAFYSALHYVRYKVFPLTVKKENGDPHIHKSFDDYSSYHRYDGIGKHEMLLELVATHCPEILFEYNQLKDVCWTARYVDYKFDRDVSNLAKKHQKAIKEYCESTDKKKAI
jgi:hypothetical protein